MSTPSEQYIPWLDQIERERDELRAANKVLQLRGDTYLEQLQQKHAEVERLTLADKQWADHVKRLADERDRARAEVERLQADLAAHHEQGTEHEVLPGTVMCSVCKQVRLAKPKE